MSGTKCVNSNKVDARSLYANSAKYLCIIAFVPEPLLTQTLQCVGMFGASFLDDLATDSVIVFQVKDSVDTFYCGVSQNIFNQLFSDMFWRSIALLITESWLLSTSILCFDM